MLINSLSARGEGNDSSQVLRIILDLSAPHLKEWEEKLGVPGSVNSGIDKKKYSCSMADTEEILRVLHRLGKDVEFTKVDWTSAYKHLGVKKEDLVLQCIQWGGKVQGEIFFRKFSKIIIKIFVLMFFGDTLHFKTQCDMFG